MLWQCTDRQQKQSDKTWINTAYETSEISFLPKAGLGIYREKESGWTVKLWHGIDKECMDLSCIVIGVIPDHPSIERVWQEAEKIVQDFCEKIVGVIKDKSIYDISDSVSTRDFSRGLI